MTGALSSPTTVKDWSDGFNELKEGDSSPSVRSLRTLLDQAGIDMNAYEIEDGEDTFDYGVEEAVKKFQKEEMGMSPNDPSYGIVNDDTINALLAVSDNMSDLIYNENVPDDGSGNGTDTGTADNDNPHFGSFFGEGNEKLGRQNGTEIKIILGDKHIIKRLHNVVMRSVTTEFDTSGNPIAEVYEFIAQDLTESDEINDIGKY